MTFCLWRWRYRRPPWWPTLAMLQLRIGFSSASAAQVFASTLPLLHSGTALAYNPITNFSLCQKEKLAFNLAPAAAKLFEVSCILTQPSSHKVNMERCLFTSLNSFFLKNTGKKTKLFVSATHSLLCICNIA